MLEISLKQKILENGFVFEIRHLNVNHQSFDGFCKLLTELAVAWKEKKEIDKEIAAELYGVFVVTLNTEKSLRKQGSRLADEVADMVQDLDRLILDCLGP